MPHLSYSAAIVIGLKNQGRSSYFHTTIRMGNRDMHEETKRAVETALGVGFFGGAGRGVALGLLG